MRRQSGTANDLLSVCSKAPSIHITPPIQIVRFSDMWVEIGLILFVLAMLVSGFLIPVAQIVG